MESRHTQYQLFEVFGKLKYDKFFGVYDYKSDYGIVHYADNKKVKGAKFFIWGNDGRGNAWNRALTDDDTKYLEIQSGLFETQEVFKFLQPYQEINWSEYWYPVANMGGFKLAEKDMAVNYSIYNGKLRFNLISAQDIGDCLLDIKVNGTSQKIKVCLITGIPVAVDYDKNVSSVNELKLHIEACGNSFRHSFVQDDRLKFDVEEINTDLYEDSRIIPDPKDADKLFKKAVSLESTGNCEDAFNLYIRILEENPNCTLTLNRLGRLYLKKDMYNEAQECFMKVLKYDNRNSEARFLYGIAEREKGNIRNAYRVLSDISYGAQYFEASLIEMVKVNIMLGRFLDAIDLLENTIKEHNSYTLFLSSVCCRKAGLCDKAQYILSNAGQMDEFLFAEKFLVGSAVQECKAFLEYIGYDKKQILGISLQYAELGMFEDAKAILALYSGNGIKARLLDLWSGRDTEGWNEKWAEPVLAASLDYEFVNEKLLARIIEQNCHMDLSGRLDYLLGNYRYWQGRKKDALEHFMSAYEKGLRYTVLLKNIGYTEYYYNNDPKAAAKYLEEDVIANNSLNEYSMVLLDRIYRENGELDKRKALLKCLESVRNRSWVINVIVNTLKDAGMEDKALNILENEQFENWEGREVSGALYRDVILGLVVKSINDGNIKAAADWIEKIQSYPRNINYGETPYTLLSDVYYYRGLVYSLSGRHEEAKLEFKKGAKELDRMNTAITDAHYLFSMKCVNELQKML
jgi:tetratricopeptide (TPR) repeat protein